MWERRESADNDRLLRMPPKIAAASASVSGLKLGAAPMPRLRAARFSPAISSLTSLAAMAAMQWLIFIRAFPTRSSMALGEVAQAASGAFICFLRCGGEVAPVT
jgi:hypothetical protein